MNRRRVGRFVLGDDITIIVFVSLSELVVVWVSFTELVVVDDWIPFSYVVLEIEISFWYIGWVVVDGFFRVIMMLIKLIDRFLIEVLYQVLMVGWSLVAYRNLFSVCNSINARQLLHVFFILNNFNRLLDIIENLLVPDILHLTSEC